MIRDVAERFVVLQKTKRGTFNVLVLYNGDALSSGLAVRCNYSKERAEGIREHLVDAFCNAIHQFPTDEAQRHFYQPGTSDGECFNCGDTVDSSRHYKYKNGKVRVRPKALGRILKGQPV